MIGDREYYENYLKPLLEEAEADCREAMLHDERFDAGICNYCCNADGPDHNDKCGHYKMPLWMVVRKKKCKHYSDCTPY